MGASESTLDQNHKWVFKDLSPDDIEFVKKFTKGSFSNKEIQLFHYAFMSKMKIIPVDGKISRDLFQSFFKELGEEWLIDKLMFRIDRDGEGIDFFEFMRWLYLLSRGTIEERRRLVFSIYDWNDNQVITKDDMKKFIDGLSWRLKNAIQLKPELDPNAIAQSPTSSRLNGSKEENEKEGKKLLRVFRHKDKEPKESKELKEETDKKLKKKEKKPKKKFIKETQTLVWDLFARGEYEVENTVENLRFALDDPHLKKQHEQLIEIVDRFFGDKESISLSDYESRYPSISDVENKVFTGFGILELCYHKMFEPIEKRIIADISSPPTREGYLFKRNTGLTTSTDFTGTFLKKWFVLKQGFLFIYSSKSHNNKESKPEKVLPLLNTTVSVKTPGDAPDTDCFYIRSALPNGEVYGRYLKTVERGENFEWAYDLICNVQEIPENRYHSFAPPREGAARWFVDGQDTFSFVADCIKLARKEIFITDWWLCPEIYLKRDLGSDFGPHNRLDILLQKKAEEGVLIYILLWNETKIALELNSTYTKNKLEKLHRNITVLRHPDSFPVYWSHHQKSVIVDQDIAFVGGLDLCYGRWDIPSHPVTDSCHLRTLWPGKDYCNEGAKLTTNIELPFVDFLDRCMEPRMPWHDIHVAVDGPAARDIAYNFIQRWNHHVMGTTITHLFPKSLTPRLVFDVEGFLTVMDYGPLLPSDESDTNFLLPEKMKFSKSTSIATTGAGIPVVAALGLLGFNPGKLENDPTPTPLVKSHRRASSLNESKSQEHTQRSRASSSTSTSPRTSNNLYNSLYNSTNNSHSLKIYNINNNNNNNNNYMSNSSNNNSNNSSMSNSSSSESTGSIRKNSHSRRKSSVSGGNRVPCFSSKCRIQVLRSLGLWSGGQFTETSVHQAYLDLINNAEHFIYIENQYFISSLAGGSCSNNVAEAILNRIRRAIMNNEVFRVIIVLPVFPTGGSWKDSASIQYVMNWQYKTINRGKNSIIETLQRQYPGVDAEDYISFYCLRNHGELLGNPVTEQIYVHSKLMIVDDRAVIIGSANINDRSLAGDRDSEICVVVEDHNRLTRKMNGQPYTVRRFAHELRMQLCREHLGIYDNDAILEDPVSAAFYKDTWIAGALFNTRIYTSLFHDIPSDSIQSFQELSHRERVLKTWLADPDVKQNALEALESIKGHLTMFPYNFLKEESLSPSLSNTEYLLPPEIFQ